MTESAAQVAWSDFTASFRTTGADAASVAFRREYDALMAGPAIVDRSYRGLLEVRGADRAAWLHNLLTNQVKPLGQGDGVYAYALNVQGRILFDCNLWVRGESIWLDIDRDFLSSAIRHLEKYHITEMVELTDRSNDYVRIGFSGAGAGQVAAELGAPQAAKMPALGITRVTWQGEPISLVRHDFCGPFGIELVVPADMAIAFWKEWTQPGRSVSAVPVGDSVVQARRIEAGIPWSGREITDEYLPAETGQMLRAVSNQKGCYLGQEIVERMRARDVVARMLTGLLITGERPPSAGDAVLDPSGKPIGVVTSSCNSPMMGQPIALGYLKSAAVVPGAENRIITSGAASLAVVAVLPFAVPSDGDPGGHQSTPSR